MDHKIIQNAIDIASKAHKDQFRNNGLDPYIKHCLRTSHYIEKVYSKYATTEVIASIQGGGQGAGIDTVVAGPHFSDYSASMTRGWWFQAQSSFSISSIVIPSTANIEP